MARLFENTRNALVVHLKGEIDQCAASEIRDSIDIEIMNSPKKNLIIDLDAVTLMDSSGIGLVMGRFRTIQPLGGKLIVSNLSPQVYRIMQLAGLEKIAKISKREDVNNAENQ